MGSAKWMMGVAAAALMAGQAKADLVISGHVTTNVSCANGTCTATAPNAALNVGDLANMLASGDVKVLTGGGASNIVVAAGLSWTSTSRLTLDANESVTIQRPMTVAGTGAVTIATNDGGSGGDLMFAQKGKVNFWDTASSLVINGQSYTLVNNIATLAANIAAAPSGFYAFANDYDASVDGTYTRAPIITPLSGTFEGLNHTIDWLSISGSNSDLGLFAAASGTLRDIQVTNANISGSKSGAGVLLALGQGVRILNCSASGTIALTTGKNGAGGLVEAGKGSIDHSSANVNVTVDDAADVGGLVGGSQFSIVRSYATGNVTGGDHASVGGLVGALLDNLGGAAIDQSFATGSVTAKRNANVGGLVGLSSGGATSNSYARGDVTGGRSADVGGLEGQIGAAGASFSYSTGRVKGGSKGITKGGFIGVAGGDDALRLDYWDIETSRESRRHGVGTCEDTGCRRLVKGLTTNEFRSQLPEGFDSIIWGQKSSLNSGYPYLLTNPPPP